MHLRPGCLILEHFPDTLAGREGPWECSPKHILLAKRLCSVPMITELLLLLFASFYIRL